jgi:hypothetical protein
VSKNANAPLCVRGKFSITQFARLE